MKCPKCNYDDNLQLSTECSMCSWQSISGTFKDLKKAREAGVDIPMESVVEGLLVEVKTIKKCALFFTWVAIISLCLISWVILLSKLR